MKINLSGHHVEVKSSIQEHLEEKFLKLGTHFPSLIAIDVIISKEKNKFQVELITNYEGGRIITDYRTIHAVLYLVVMFFLSPFVWQVCFFEEPRKRFIVSYVHSILKGEDK